MYLEQGDLSKFKLDNFEAADCLNRINYLHEIHSNISTLSADKEKYITENFRILLRFIPFFPSKTCFGHYFERVVINRNVREDKRNKRLSHYDQIKYPPPKVAEKLSYNRASLPRQSVFYAGHGKLATALETKPTLGDLVTTSKWRQKPDSKITYIPIFHQQDLVRRTREFVNDWNEFNSMLAGLNSNVARVIKELYHFITAAFISPVNPDNKKEYLFSALFADLFFNDADFGIDCIYYPSVPSEYATSNIALKPLVLEEKFELIGVSEEIFVSSPDRGMGQWMSYRSANAVNIDMRKDEIEWEGSLFDEEDVKSVIKEYEVELS